MALPKAVHFAVIFLVVCYSLEKRGYRTSMTVFLEELIGIKTSSLHDREKRATLANATDYELQVVISLSELESLRAFLNSLSLPILINSTTEITSIDTTTVCSSNMTVYQCTCEESFAWSYNNCRSHGACDPIIGNTCGCIKGLPAGDQYCQPKQTDPVDIDVVLELHIPLSSVPSGFIDIFRNNLNSVSFPRNISQSLILVDLNFTTGCYPNSTGGLQCQCEDEYAWSCDKCIVYGDCSNTSSQTCSCINGLPPDREFCQPITGVSLCPTPTPVTTTTALPNTTAASSPKPTDPLDIVVVLELRIPVSSVSLDFIRNALQNSSFPNNQYLKVMDLNFTTSCYPNSTGGMQCHCEDQFAWSCDKCANYGECSNTSKQTCRCINDLPGDGEFCQPITSIAPCSTSSPVTPTTSVITTTLPMTTNTTATTPTPMASTTSMTTMQNITSQLTTTLPVTTTTTATTPTPVTSTTSMTTMQNITSQLTTTLPVTTTTTATTPVTSTTSMTTMQNITSQLTTTLPVTTTTTATTPMPVTSTTSMTTMQNITSQLKTTPTASENITLELVMNLPYNESYNTPSDPVYKDVKEVIERKCREHIKNLQSVKLLKIRNGSTIADYEVIATSINVSEIENVKTGIFSDLGKSYSMIYQGESLIFDPKETFFFEQTMIVKCGPPPRNLGEKWEAEWTRDGKPIVRDTQHNVLNENGQSKLTVDSFFATDKGLYECKLKFGKSYFRQTGQPKAEEKPDIRVVPVTKLVQCNSKSVTLTCSVAGSYEVRFEDFGNVPKNKITHEYSIPEDCKNEVKTFSCHLNNNNNTIVKSDITLKFTTEKIVCFDKFYGDGIEGFTAEVACEENKVGKKTAVCSAKGVYENKQDNCVLKEVQKLLDQSKSITEERLPEFLDQLSNVTVNNNKDVTGSPATIKAIVVIFENVANATLSLSIAINSTLMEDVLFTAGILTSEDAAKSWVTLNNANTNRTETKSSNSKPRSFSSSLLQSLEDITKSLNNESFNIATDLILLNKTTFTDSFNEEFDSSVEIEIPGADGGKKSITVITFSSMDNVLPAREEANSLSNSINGRVALIQSSGKINNISITFDTLSDTLGNPKCVFWNFSLLDGLGGWDDEGCSLVVFENETVSCNCNHLTSFSILMSPNSPNNSVLDFITYIGVGISLGSLVICLIIEAVIWKKIRRNTTSYLRHVSIVNIALSLLIANIWFIIGAAISKADQANPPACTAAAFFIHFFYLSLFFWMLASALLLLYRTVSVFDGGLSKMAMLAIGFSLGYGAPLIIATITIAVTAPKEEYIRDNEVCWLNWDESKALLAFVIPALLIVLINLIILVVVVYKMLRRRVGGSAAQAAEKHVLVVIARCLAVLTPFFGLTWSLGVGIMINPANEGIHIAFAFFNSLQGFFILVFGTLLDKKVRSELTLKSQTSQSGTASTSAGFSFSNLGIFRKWRQKRGFSSGLNVSSNATESQSFTNT